MDIVLAFHTLFFIAVLSVIRIVWAKKFALLYTKANESEYEYMSRNSRWILLASKLHAADIYYIKRTARCRRGRSPSRSFSSSSGINDDQSSEGSFRQMRTTSSVSMQERKEMKSMREICKLRAWKSFNGL